MKKSIILLLFISSIFGDYILLDRLETAKHKICPISKRERKRFFLLEIRERNDNSFLYLFEKKINKYKFIYGFDLNFMGKEVYFQGFIDKKTKKMKRKYLYYCNFDKDKIGNLIYLVGGKLSKKEVLKGIKKIDIWNKKKGRLNSKWTRKKNSFYAKKYINLFMPEKKEKKPFFMYTSRGNFYKRLNTIPIGYYDFLSIPISNPAMLSLNAYADEIFKLNQEQKKFRNKYYFDFADLQKQGIAEPAPMWDAKVKPYKNVFGEELLD